ncbi:hypothetical protein FAVG1_10858 [Fusarium avenaceum]|nr:hypothetical protein FAVG1_10858 [Fusarium avenaceum]
MMYQEEEPFCDICGLSIETALRDTDGRLQPEIWREDAFAVEGPECLPKHVETSSCADKLFTWHAATGYTNYEDGQLTLLPSGDTVVQHRVNSIAHSRFVQRDHLFLGFHRACVSIAREFIQRSPVSKLHSFCDIWTTLNARNSEGPVGHGFWGKALSIPEKTARGTLVWSQELAYYLPHPGSSTTYLTPWWDSDPLHIPDITTRLLENLQSRPIPPSIESSQFATIFGNLPPELGGIVMDYLSCMHLALQPTDMMPQLFWKQFLIRIPFLWDLDKEQLEQFPELPADQGKEWHWEQLVRQLMIRPTQSVPFPYEVCNGASFQVWDYSHGGLDVPLGLTNRRRIWQILHEMDPEELDVLHHADFIVYDQELDDFIRRTEKDGLNVVDLYVLDDDDDGSW